MSVEHSVRDRRVERRSRTLIVRHADSDWSSDRSRDSKFVILREDKIPQKVWGEE